MKIFGNPKQKNKMTEKEARQIFLNCVTGNISTEEFWEMYKNNAELRNFLINDKKRNKPQKVKTDCGTWIVRYNDRNFPLNADNLLEKFDINKLEHRYELYTILKRYFIARNIVFADFEINQDAKDYLLYQSMLPDWVSVDDVNYLKNIYESAPKNLTNEQKLKWCKGRVKELFRYENKKPDWVQEPEWPIVDGKPLIFLHQKCTEEGLEQYYFYDEERKIEKIIEQCE